MSRWREFVASIVRADLRVLFACVLASVCVVAALAQDEMPPEPEPEQPAEPKGSLQPRPDEDPQTIAWVKALAGARPQSLSVAEGVLLRHCLTPEGDRFYYYRETARVEAKDDKPGTVSYALFCVGSDKSESKVADTGAAALPPIFLADGRILFVSRRHDLNDDALVDELDDAALMVSNRDGGNLRSVASLGAGEVPVAAWREGREVLIATPGDDEVSGWIVSLNIVTGKRENVVQAFNVALVLADDRLLIERMQATEPPKKPMRWDRRGPAAPEEVETPEPGLLDHVEYLVYEPKDGNVVSLFRPSRKSRIVVTGDNSYFGVQERDVSQSAVRGNPYSQRQGALNAEILIIDDAEHRDTRSPAARYSYEVLGWIEGRGALLVERGNLGSRLMLMDRALKFHRLAEFDLVATGYCASRDGLTVGWLEVEDTDKNGLLEPWADKSRPHYLKIE
ncbi:MAG: hypothetical protein IPK87_15440 [Planctomycetes bacterium]|nr:hypothetical protein [Planctomycetota bacterium]